MENLIPNYIKTIENLTTLKLNDDLWVSVKCYIPEARAGKDGRIMESGVMYWTDRKTKYVNFYSNLSSCIFIKLRQSNEAIMLISRNKASFTNFLKRSLITCRKKENYIFKRKQLVGVNLDRLPFNRLEYALSQKMEKIVSSIPIVIQDITQTKLLNGIELSINNRYNVDLTVEELETLIEHIESINLIIFTQNAINSIQWKIDQFNKVHTQGINEFKLKIKMLGSMDKEDMIGLARGMELDVSELALMKEKQINQTESGLLYFMNLRICF